MSEQTKQQQLDENIPRDVISSRDGGGNKKLSYLETWYVIDRLNQVLGTSNWSNEIIKLAELPGTGKPAYMAIVKITATIDGRTVVKDGVGYGSDKSTHNAHELAMKEACSDALKVAAKNLGRSLGLALYDKTQEYVSDVVETNTASVTQQPKVETSTKSSGPDPRSIIKAQFKALKAAKKVDVETFKTKYLASRKVDDLTDGEANNLLNTIKTDYPDLIV